ncbi:HAD family hydrolase [Rhodovibrionaceae bacterium A322]
MAIKGILFDKDGTLFDYQATWSPVNRKAAIAAASGNVAVSERLLAIGGHNPETDEVQAGSLLAAGNTSEIAMLWAAELPHRRVGELVELLDRVFQNEGIVSAVPVTDLEAFFTRLRSLDLRLGIATNDSQVAAELTVERFDLRQLLDFIAGYDSGYGVKPGPGMVEAFCRTTSLNPAEVMVVGDNTHDMQMGEAAGAGKLVGVLTGTSSRGVLSAHANHVLNSIDEIFDILG